MRLTVKQIVEATPIIAAIINEKRPMSQKGKYRLARMHAKLLPEYTMAMSQRDDLIKAYDAPATETVVDEETGARDVPIPGLFRVPDDKLPEFDANWGKILADEIDIDVEPLPLELVDLGDTANGSIEALEIAALGDLIA